MADEKPKELRIKNVNKTVYQDLNNIAANLGISMAGLIKPELQKLRDSYPLQMREDPNK